MILAQAVEAQDLFLLPQVIVNVLWWITRKSLKKSFYAGMTAVRLQPHLYDYVKAPAINSYFAEAYEFVNTSLDFYSQFSDITIPLAAAVYVQQRWNYKVISKGLQQQWCFSHGVNVTLLVAEVQVSRLPWPPPVCVKLTSNGDGGDTLIPVTELDSGQWTSHLNFWKLILLKRSRSIKGKMLYMVFCRLTRTLKILMGNRVTVSDVWVFASSDNISQGSPWKEGSSKTLFGAFALDV